MPTCQWSGEPAHRSNRYTDKRKLDEVINNDSLLAADPNFGDVLCFKVQYDPNSK